MVSPVIIIAAMPEELTPLLQRVADSKKCTIAGLPAWQGTLGAKPLIVLRSGMGTKRASAAALAALQLNPATIYSIGFGGAVRSGLAAGDLVLGSRLFTVDEGTATPVPAPTLLAASAFNGPRRFVGSILTAERILDKKIVATILPDDLPHPVLEMETMAVAAAAGRGGVPFVALRAISDPADEELGFGLDEFCDRELNLQIWRVLLTVARKPWIVPQLLRLARNSRLAAQALANGVVDLLSAP